MARNSEKAQSMLYRFREQQAIDMGMGNRIKGDRRPRMASACNSLRDCERWRGDILRDISRKVSKIQDVSLGDYEIRDLNDEINALFREKRHWETQIVNLGGANYKRGNIAMTDDEGREVPGTRGYKYFGRAKDLPGVKELFTRGAQQATEDSARNASFQMFRNQGPSYYGDEDELDQDLLAEEEDLAKKDWEEAARVTAQSLDVQDDVPYPVHPSASTSSSIADPSTSGASATATASNVSTKRKAPADREPASEDTSDGVASGEVDGVKKTKLDAESDVPAANGNADSESAATQLQAQTLNFFSILDPESLKFPSQPTKEEMAKVLLEVRKQALRDEYGV